LTTVKSLEMGSESAACMASIATHTLETAEVWADF